MPSKTPLVDVLASLDSYNTAHAKGSSSLKLTIWNTSKARQQAGRYSYSACDVREELRASAVLECNEEPILEDENAAEKNVEKNENDLDPFVLHFGGIPKKKDENDAPLKTSDAFGLRQRKGKDSEEESADKEWLEVLFVDEEEEKLRNTDPIGENIILI